MYQAIPEVLHAVTATIRLCKANKGCHIAIMDTGGGTTPTITSAAWMVLEHTNLKARVTGYQDRGEVKERPVVNAITKVHIRGQDMPVLFAVNMATLIEDHEESESLLVPYTMMRHSVEVDMVPPQHGGKCGITVEEQFFSI